MQLPITMHMAQKYAVSRDNPEDVFTFLHKNFGCSRKVYNLCVDSLYRQLETAGYQSGDDIPAPVFPKASALKKEYPYLKEADSLGLAEDTITKPVGTPGVACTSTGRMVAAIPEKVTR